MKSTNIKVLLLTIALWLPASGFAQFPGFGGFPGGGFPDGFPGGGFPGSFSMDSLPNMFPGGFFGRFPEGFPDSFPSGFPGGGFPGGFGMGVEYDPASSRNEVAFTSSNLPIVLIDTEGHLLTNKEKSLARMKIIDNGKGKRNHLTDKARGYDGYIGIKLRGNSSLFFEQKRFTFETKTEDGKDLDAELLGMPADNDWVLLAPYNDISMMRDPFAFDLWREMGHWAPRNRYCEVVMNGRYIGVYILCEKIKRGENRLDIAKLKPEDNSGRELTGGYIVRIDPPDEGEPSFTSEVPGIINRSGGFGGGNFGGFGDGGFDFGGFGGGFNPFEAWGDSAFAGFGGGRFSGFEGFGGNFNQVVWTYYYPKPDKITPEQQEYISSYVKTVERVIQSEGFADPDSGYAKYISVSSFVDYFIHTELSLNADGLKRSTYFFKTKQKEDGTGGKLHAGTVWDYNLAYGNCNFCNADKIDAWVYEGGETNPTPAMWKRLTEDPAFMAKVVARWKELRQGTLSIDNINRYIDEHALLLAEAKDRQYAKYPDLLIDESDRQGQGGRNGFGGPGMGFGGFGAPGGGMDFGGFGGGGAGMFAAYRVSSYEEEIATLKKWFADRIAFLDSHWK